MGLGRRKLEDVLADAFEDSSSVKRRPDDSRYFADQDFL
jgi:hypothetical protein